jgi:hypothetical protein
MRGREQRERTTSNGQPMHDIRKTEQKKQPGPPRAPHDSLLEGVTDLHVALGNRNFQKLVVQRQRRPRSQSPPPVTMPPHPDPGRAEQDRLDQLETSSRAPVGQRLTETVTNIVTHYAQQEFGLGDRAGREWLRQVRREPGAVIPASVLLGAAGVGALMALRRPLPAIPIPLDLLGARFRGVSVQLRLSGPITSPESFNVRVSFSERLPAPRSRPNPVELPPTLNEILDPAQVAADAVAAAGPAGQAWIREIGSEAVGLTQLVGNTLLAAIRREERTPLVDLGAVDHLPPAGETLLRQIVTRLTAAAPRELSTPQGRVIVQLRTRSAGLRVLIVNVARDPR